MIVARPLLGNFDQAFQYIQEFTGFFTPGIVAIFLLGFFWKRTTPNGALGAAIGSAVLSLGFKLASSACMTQKVPSVTNAHAIPTAVPSPRT